MGNSDTAEYILKCHFKVKYFENTTGSQKVTVGTGSTCSGHRSTRDGLTKVVVVEAASRSQV